MINFYKFHIVKKSRYPKSRGYFCRGDRSDIYLIDIIKFQWKMMKIKFLGAAGTVTGSKYLITIKNRHIMVDCGLFQGLKPLRNLNWENLPFDITMIDAVLITHAHIDHTGYLPKLVKSGYKGPIYATPATADLCSILLPDSGSIQEEDARQANKHQYSKHHPALPLYTKDEAEAVLEQFKVIQFNQQITIAPGIEAIWHRAGHILGAAFIQLKAEGKELVFSGDMGRFHDPVMHAPVYMKSADYLILESTYGDRLHSNENPHDLIAKVINKTVKKNGTVLIPAFAVGRAQAILYYLSKLKEQDMIPDIPVFLDSPMSIKATKLLQKYVNEHRLSEEQCEKACNVAEYIRTQKESKELFNVHGPKIIISASGMLTGGRILHHLSYFGPDPDNTILIVGYQAAGTRGRHLLEGKKSVKIHGRMVNVNATVEYISSFSAHADYKDILEWLEHFKKKPRKIFITHGEPVSSENLKKEIEEKFDVKCHIPKYLEEDYLD